MSDVKFSVSVDSEGAIKKLDNLERQLGKLGTAETQTGLAAEQSEKKSSGLWKQMAIGSLVASAATRAFAGIKAQLSATIAAYAEQERADVNLRASLELTGRTIEGNFQHYKNYASELQAVTKYGDEQIQAAQSLLLTMTRLNQEGVDKATRGAIGLASVFGMDLVSATQLVQKALGGMMGALSRYGIRVDENLSKEEQQAQLLEKLELLYKRALAETESYGGGIAQLKNYWGDIQEEIGKALVGNKDFIQGIKDLKEWLKNFVTSDTFTLWVSSTTELVSKLVRAVAGIGRAVISVEETLMGSKGYRQYIAQVNEATGVIQQGINVQTFRRQAIERELISVREWGEMWQRYGRSFSAMMKGIAEGKEGETLKALFDEIKESTDEAKRAAEALKPAINETGDAIAQTKEKTTSLKDELKLVFREDIISQIEKVESALEQFGDRMPASQVQKLRDELSKLRAELSPTEINAVDEALKSFGLRTVSEVAERFGVLSEALNRVDALYRGGAIDLNEYQRVTAELNKELAKNQILFQRALPAGVSRFAATLMTMTPTITAAASSWSRAFQSFAQRAATSMEKIQNIWATVNASMTTIFSQAQRNREIQIDNEYKQRVDTINQSVVDEESRQKALMALEAEYEIQRTSAQRTAAKQAKAAAIMEAIINTATAVTKALAQGGFLLGIPWAAVVGALGAAQVAMIAAQPIPLARGAVFNERTQMVSESGALYEMGEAGVEYLIPEKHLVNLLAKVPAVMSKEVVREKVEKAPTYVINVNSPLVRAAGVSVGDLERVGSDLYRIIEREARRRGR